MKVAPVLVALALASACGDGVEPSPPPAPTVRPSEGELGVIRLAPASIASLGIETSTISSSVAPRTRTVGGVVTVPSGRVLTVAAPVAGKLRAGDRTIAAGTSVGKGEILYELVPIAPVDRDLRAQSRRQRDASKARLDVARARLERTRTLLAQRGASQRALEEAEAELATAEAEDAAASARERMLRRSPLDADAVLGLAAPQDGVVRTIGAVAGQSVAAGTALFEISATRGLWVRVPLFAGELARVSASTPVRVRRLGDDAGEGELAVPVDAPPSADAASGSVDLFYALPGDSTELRPGERVMVELGYGDDAARISVPASAIVFDFDGGSWIYECVADGGFRRRRVEVLRRDAGRAVLGHGPASGTCVVTVGALELLGAELGVAH